MRAIEHKTRRRDVKTYRQSIAALLVSKNFHSKCISKKPYGFNKASEIATDFWEKGHFSVEPYYCVRCWRWHVGHGSPKLMRYHCPWCGNKIRSSRKGKHALKCGRLVL